MARLQLALFASAVLCLSAANAEDNTKPDADDPVAAELKKANEEYQSAVEKAGDRLLVAFSDRQKELEKDTRRKVDEVIKLVEQVQEEKKAFEADPAKLPKSAGMKVAVRDYQTKLGVARKKCESAFDRAAEAYRGKKPPDLTSAKAVLLVKAEFTKSNKSTNVSEDDLIANYRKDVVKYLVSKKWDFCEGNTIHATLVFVKGGRITGSKNTNESAWNYENKIGLVILNARGIVSARYTVVRVEEGRIVIVGQFMLAKENRTFELRDVVDE